MPSFSTIPSPSIRTSPLSKTNAVPGTEESKPVATVSVGLIASTDTPSKFETQPAGTLWTELIVRNRYEKDGHIYMMGVTSSTGFSSSSSAFVQLASPTLIWISDWTACRFGNIPSIPEPSPPANSNWVLMDEHYEPGMIDLGPDGVTPIYRISGTYVYGAKNPRSRTVYDIAFAKPPWLKDEFRRLVYNSDYLRGIINPTF